MDTSPWNYWQADRKTPNPGLEDLVPTLEAVLKKNPRHPGAQHLYIHAVEASSNPGRAERYADLLAPAMPGAGHLVHMPSHIYNRIGRYADGVRVNEAAAKADESYFASTNDRGMYAGMYYVHNLHFVWTSASTEGRSATAIEYAKKVVYATPPDFAHAAPPAEVFLPTTLYAYLRFGKWDEVIATPKFDGQFAFANAMWHYAQARAFAAKGNFQRAESEQALIASSFPKGEAERFAQFDVPGKQLVEIAEHVAQAEIFHAQRKVKDEIAELEAAMRLQDGLKYMEPPYWDFPVRHYLGAAYLVAGRARDAERVYREDLKEWPKNGWSLFGLSQALTRQGRAKDARRTKREFDQAWARADVTLTQSRF
jgi:tetratricopeptide (TPR) repeat protein